MSEDNHLNLDVGTLQRHISDSKNPEIETLKRQLSLLLDNVDDENEFKVIQPSLPKREYESVITKGTPIVYVDETTKHSLPSPDDIFQKSQTPIIDKIHPATQRAIEQKIKSTVSAINEINVSREWINPETCKVYKLFQGGWNDSGIYNRKCQKGIKQYNYLNTLFSFLFGTSHTNESDLSKDEDIVATFTMDDFWEDLNRYKRASFSITPGVDIDNPSIRNHPRYAGTWFYWTSPTGSFEWKIVDSYIARIVDDEMVGQEIWDDISSRKEDALKWDKDNPEPTTEINPYLFVGIETVLYETLKVLNLTQNKFDVFNESISTPSAHETVLIEALLEDAAKKAKEEARIALNDAIQEYEENYFEDAGYLPEWWGIVRTILNIGPATETENTDLGLVPVDFVEATEKVALGTTTSAVIETTTVAEGVQTSFNDDPFLEDKLDVRSGFATVQDMFSWLIENGDDWVPQWLSANSTGIRKRLKSKTLNVKDAKDLMS